MCTVSAVGDNYRDYFPEKWKDWTVPITTPSIHPNILKPPEYVSKEDFDALKKEVEELKLLLQAAKKFDEATNQKDCEMDDKIAFIKSVADFVGVNLDDVFGKSA
jgi:hypothetical protein